jgi:hypothetical protein
LSIIHSRQYEDLRNLRHLDAFSSEAVALRVQTFCANIVRALEQNWLSPEEREQREAQLRAEAEGRRKEQRQQAEDRRRNEQRRRLQEEERKTETEKQRRAKWQQAWTTNKVWLFSIVSGVAASAPFATFKWWLRPNPDELQYVRVLFGLYFAYGAG